MQLATHLTEPASYPGALPYRPDCTVTDDAPASLLARTARGDYRAFERLYRLTNRRLLGVAMRILGRRHVAEEVLQDAYLTIWERAHQCQSGEGSGIAWMSRVVRNRAIDRLRAEYREPVSIADAVIPEIAMTAAEEGDERTGTVGKLVARLSDNQRRALLAAFYRDMSHREVATQLGVPLGTAKSWIRRGLMELGTMLAHEH